jgi:hypothetical protein
MSQVEQFKKAYSAGEQSVTRERWFIPAVLVVIGLF